MPLDDDVLMAAASPAGFAFVASRDDADPYLPENFHLELAKGIVDIEQGRLELLVVQLPVQHGKSTTASVWGSAWMLGLHPTWFGIAATYNTEFAQDRIGKPTRDILERYGEQYFGVRVSPTSRSMKRWNTTAGGGLLSVGVDKAVTGRRGDFIIVDDPCPGIKEALNPHYWTDLVQWFKANVLTRRPKVLRMIAIMSRWGDNDFIGWLLEHAKANGWNYRLLDYPAIAICQAEGCDYPKYTFGYDDKGEIEVTMQVCEHEARDALGRTCGEPLWPKVRPLEFLLRQLKDLGSTFFESLFQGRPRKPSGSIFKREWFRYCELVDGDRTVRLFDQSNRVIADYPLNQLRKFQIVDLSSGDTQTLRSGITRTKSKPDYFVDGTFFLGRRNELIVFDIFRDNRIDGTAQVPMMAQLRAKYDIPRIGIEAVAYQWTAVQQAVALGLPAVAITRGSESKETRAWVVSARYESGQVFHMRGKPWVDALENELVAFPKGENDDQVDVLSDAGAVVAEASSGNTAQGVRVG
jgi:predicted phage terminase large subunit-like protein